MGTKEQERKNKDLHLGLKRKIRVIIGTLEVGGAEIHLSHVLPALASRGWSIQLVVLSDKVFLKNHFCHENIEIITVPSSSSRFNFLRRAYRLGRCINVLLSVYKEDPHTLTHFFLPTAYILGRLVGFLSKSTGPWVMSRRSLRLYQKKLWGCALMERFLHQRCSAILVNSQRVRDELIQHENVEPGKITLIYNGLPMERPQEQSYDVEALRIAPGTLVIVHVANLIPYKGHIDLLKALGAMKVQGYKNWIVIFIGQGAAYQKILEKEAEKQKIKNNIRWVSSCSNSESYLRIAHIGVLPSHQEGFSNALLEKMAAGLPVVATDVGGNGEAMVDKETGFLVPPHDPTTLKEALLKLMQDEELRKRMAQKGKKRFQDHFLLDRCVSHYEEFYEDQLFQRRRGGRSNR